jgi:hypothetical protein
MPPETICARATLKVRHERPFDYDERRELWLYKRIDEDEEYGNILTDGGRVTLHTYIYGTDAQRTAQNLGQGLHFVALTNNASAPSAGDVTLTGEISADGLERVIGTVSLPTDVGTLTQVQNVFTYTGGGTQSVQKTALFDAITAGNMAHEILFTQRTLATSDTLTLIFSITLA